MDMSFLFGEFRRWLSIGLLFVVAKHRKRPSPGPLGLWSSERGSVLCNFSNSTEAIYVGERQIKLIIIIHLEKSKLTNNSFFTNVNR